MVIRQAYGWRVRLRLNPAVHELWALSRFIGVRDRLRCPDCKAVGTWKAHGPRIGRGADRPVRRWMCKCCGRYEGPEGVADAWVDTDLNVWRLGRPHDPDAPEVLPPTPLELLKEAKVWPWKG